jgi:hypothetical protein
MRSVARPKSRTKSNRSLEDLMANLVNLKLRSNDEYRYDSGTVGKIARVTVKYMKTMSLSRRGIYVNVDPWEIEPDNGRGWSGESTVLCSGTKGLFVEHLARATPRKMQEIAQKVDLHAPALAAMFLTHGKDVTQAALVSLFELGVMPTVLPAVLRCTIHLTTECTCTPEDIEAQVSL